MEERILFINTGGTIDAQEYPDPNNPPDVTLPLDNCNSLVFSTIKSFPKGDLVDAFQWGLNEHFLKDSKQFTEDDIAALTEIILKTEHRLIVLSHGTDAMISNANKLKALLGDCNKVVVFTGAIVPLSMNYKFKSGGVDALGFVLENIEGKNCGVYIAARGKDQRLSFFTTEKIDKDFETSREKLSFTIKQR